MLRNCQLSRLTSQLSMHPAQHRKSCKISRLQSSKTTSWRPHHSTKNIRYLFGVRRLRKLFRVSFVFTISALRLQTRETNFHHNNWRVNIWLTQDQLATLPFDCCIKRHYKCVILCSRTKNTKPLGMRVGTAHGRTVWHADAVGL